MRRDKDRGARRKESERDGQRGKSVIRDISGRTCMCVEEIHNRKWRVIKDKEGISDSQTLKF